MCKVMIIPKINEKHKTKTVEFIKEMGKEISRANTDGLGYAAIDKDGSLFGERWLKNYQAFDNKKVKHFEKFSKAIEDFNGGETYNSFGDDPSLNKATAVTLHTRFATSAKGMANTHPFFDPEFDTSLIHNGVINNDNDFKKKLSTCDSEAILTNYLDCGVNQDPSLIQNVADALRGYYACGIFSRDNDGARILDVFKGNHASLYLQRVPELDIDVFCTSDVDVRDVCRKMGLEVTDAFKIKEGRLMRFIGGELIGITDFTVPAATYGTSHRGSHSATQTNTGKTGKESNIIDASIAGQKEKSGTMSMQSFELKRLAPSIREFSRMEVREYMDANYQDLAKRA